MHIPDGPLSPAVCAATAVMSAGAVGYSLYKLRDSLADRTVPMTGMMGALIFAGQMVNFPIGLLGVPSVSGHLMGGVLAAVMLGPWAGCLAISMVLVVQCFLFSDGGLTALGANVLNMGVAGSIGGYAVYASVKKVLGGGRAGTMAGTVIAAWISVMAAAALFCAEFALSWAGSTEYNFTNILTLMVTVHAAIGVGEAWITGSVIGFVLLQRPDLLYTPSRAEEPLAVGPASLPLRERLAGAGRFVAAGLCAALAVAAFLAPFASEYDDGLEAVGSQAFENRMNLPGRTLVFADYEIPRVTWQKLSVSLAGILGTVAVVLMAWLLDRSLRLKLALAGSHDNVQ